MTNKPVGGRGKKASYETVVIRVPKPIVNEVQLLINNFRDDSFVDISKKTVPRELAIEEAKKILKSKKSAKQSLLKLLQVLYDDKIKEESLFF